MRKQKKSGFNVSLYTFGTLLIAVLLVVVAINFARDARIFEKPLLSTPVENKSDSTDTDDYKTIKYEKPAADTPKQTAKPAAKPAATSKPSGGTKPSNSTKPTVRADP